MKKIGIIGSGVVAQVLGTGLLKHGYEVMIGTRDPKKLEAWKAKSGGQVATFTEAAAFGEFLILAVKGTVADKALHLCGVEHLRGKIVIDTCNPIADSAPENGVLRYFSEMNFSLMEKLQAEFPDARFVKAFNSIGNAYMVDPQFKDGKPTMFICGNDEMAKAEVTALVKELGHDTEDMGTAEAARAIEPLCMLWCIPGFRNGRWNHAFRLIKQ